MFHRIYVKVMFTKILNSLILFALSIVFLFGCSYLNLEPTTEDDSKLMITDSATKGENQGEDTVYYYSQGEKLFLTERKELVAIQFRDEKQEAAFLSELPMVSSLKLWDSYNELYSVNNPANILILQSIKGEISADNLEELKNREDVLFVSHPLERNCHYSVMIDEFAIKIKRLSDIQQLETLADLYGCEVFQRDIFEQDIFFIRCPKESDKGTMRIADIFYETGLFEFASPDFYTLESNYSYDTCFSSQWGLKNTGQFYWMTGIDINVESAWSITEGADGIIVAVVDDGVNPTHIDLSANMISGYDIINGLPGGAPSGSDDHGTAIAGIIAAVKDNYAGITGVAPNCKIMPVRTNTYFWSRSAGVKWAKENGADIINCSWGSTVTSNDLLIMEINSAASQGRGGKGCIIVAASGNDNTNTAFPAYLSNVIGVGAYSFDGNRKTTLSSDNENWGSNYGSGLNLIAPGVKIYSTGLGNTYDYYSGTSFSAPHVSGIAALVLSEYPELSRDQVTKSMEYSCVRPSGYTYTYSYNYPYWSIYNSEVGFGRVDAYQTLQQAAVFHQQIIDDVTSGFDVTVMNNTSYLIEEIEVELYGTVAGNQITLFSENMGDLASGNQVGYPIYRGPGLSMLTPGTTISNVHLELWAICPEDVQDGIRIAAQLDNSYPTNFEGFSFGYGDFYERDLPNTTVPNASRRRLYINILYN